ncbi:MAG: GNAT family N-acetyltransferase [Anaerolineae bacterium]|nr:GNAT family N-acetyltransferase [Anaerolineae bacterium]
MKLKFRSYQTDDDFWRMREFLRQVFLLNDRRERSWHVARLEYARWHTCINCANVRLEDVAFLWETKDQVVAILMPDGGPGEAHLMVHPTLRTPELEEEMIIVAEKRLSTVDQDGVRQLYVWAPEQDQPRQQILSRRGYIKGEWPEYQWRRRLDGSLPDVPVPPGYTLRALEDGLELLERCYASGLGFHEGDITIAVDNRNDVTWYRNIQTAPLYRRDLDLVAIAPDGAVASFCTLWFDDVTRSALFDPVATVPAHQRRGLARALLVEGMRRAQRMGATLAFVNGYDTGPNAFYKSVVGPEHDLYVPWLKEWR